MPIPQKKRDLLKEQVLRTIRRHGPITAHAIAERLPILTNDPVRVIQRKVRTLIVKDRRPIASSTGVPAGYFLVTGNNPDAAYRYVLQLRSRIIAIAERLGAFKKSTARKIQLLLFEEIPTGLRRPDYNILDEAVHPVRKPRSKPKATRARKTPRKPVKPAAPAARRRAPRKRKKTARKVRA